MAQNQTNLFYYCFKVQIYRHHKRNNSLWKAASSCDYRHTCHWGGGDYLPFSFLKEPILRIIEEIFPC